MGNRLNSHVNFPVKIAVSTYLYAIYKVGTRLWV